MNCLITGSNGFLGKVISKYLIERMELVTLSRSNSNYNVDLSREIPVFSKSFDLVIHAAGLAHVSFKKKYKNKLFEDINVTGTKNLLEGLSNVGCPDELVFISSVAVYGRDHGILICERSELLAKDSYGKSKIEAEKLVRDWCEKNEVTCTILRLPIVVGLNPPGNLGAIIKAIRSNYYFNIGGGNSRKSMVLANDVARYILKASKVGGTYNLTDGCHSSFFELTSIIASQLGKRQPLSLNMGIAKCIARIGDIMGNSFPFNTERMLKMTADLTFDDSLARQTFDWKPISVLEGIKILETN
jgi:nucleoside-diphosphate-sugar epimerase